MHLCAWPWRVFSLGIMPKAARTCSDCPEAPLGWQNGRIPAASALLHLMPVAYPAGGAATDGRQRILDIQPTGLHQRVPLFIGAREEVERVTSYHLQADQA